MSREYFNCPYCNEEIYIDLEDERQDEVYFETCEKCNKKFKYHFRYSVDLFADVIKEKS